MGFNSSQRKQIHFILFLNWCPISFWPNNIPLTLLPIFFFSILFIFCFKLLQMLQALQVFSCFIWIFWGCFLLQTRSYISSSWSCHKRRRLLLLLLLLLFLYKGSLFHCHLRLLHTNIQNSFQYKILVLCTSFVFSYFLMCASECNVLKKKNLNKLFSHITCT